MKYLNLIRYQNLLLIALMQGLFRYGFLTFQNIPLALTHFQYVLLIFATLSIAAGGYIINNIMDQETDRHNKPHDLVVGNGISEAAAYNFYLAFTSIGVAVGFYLSNIIEKPGFASIFIVIAATLYLYATSFKQMLLLGNLLIASLLAMSVLIIGFFDLLPAILPGNKILMAEIFSILIDYALFAFVLNLIREIVKDLEDVNGDYIQKMNTLPITLGIERTAKTVAVFTLLPLLMVFYYINKYFFANQLYIATVYSLVFIASPLIYFMIKIIEAKKSNHFKHLSRILKFIILFGMLSIAIVTYNILHHA